MTITNDDCMNPCCIQHIAIHVKTYTDIYIHKVKYQNKKYSNLEICTLYTVQCITEILYTVILYSVQCRLYTVQCTLYCIIYIQYTRIYTLSYKNHHKQHRY